MAGLLGGGGNRNGGNSGLLGGVLNTVGETTKGLPIVGEITDPLLKTVGGVTDGLPIVGSGGLGGQQQAQPQAQRKAKAALTPEEQKALEKKRRLIALRKQQLALEAEEMALDE